MREDFDRKNPFVVQVCLQLTLQMLPPLIPLKPQIGHDIGLQTKNPHPISVGTKQSIPRNICGGWHIELGEIRPKMVNLM